MSKVQRPMHFLYSSVSTSCPNTRSLSLSSALLASPPQALPHHGHLARFTTKRLALLAQKDAPARVLMLPFCHIARFATSPALSWAPCSFRHKSCFRIGTLLAEHVFAAPLQQGPSLWRKPLVHVSPQAPTCDCGLN